MVLNRRNIKNYVTNQEKAKTKAKENVVEENAYIDQEQSTMFEDDLVLFRLRELTH